MRIKIHKIKINPGRREAAPKAIEELARSIAAVGLLNPITLDQNNTLVAGLHRLEAAKLLGWSEIECNIIGMDSLQSELAEIDENIVRTKLTRQELSEQLLRRKEIYEMFHPETKAGTAQAAGMNRAIGNNVSDKLAPTSKSFVEDTSEKTGMSKRTVSRLLQIANNMTPDAKKIVQTSDLPQDTALKISRLPHDQQAEAASLLADGTVQSVEQYQQERRDRITAAHPSLPSESPKTTQTEAKTDWQRKEALDGLVREFCRFIECFLHQMEVYQNFASDFAEMTQPQISQVWDSAAAVNMAIIAFSKEVKAIQAEHENGGNEHEN